VHFGFDHVHLVGSDLDASERFYREMSGAETVGRRDAGDTYDHFGVVVQDLTSAVEELRGKGVKILQEPRTARPGTQVAFIEGPDHTRIEVLQRDSPVDA
jgi:catechol 2,3-dioxygenase-like lactoylglutathione lyase family enzyme